MQLGGSYWTLFAAAFVMRLGSVAMPFLTLFLTVVEGWRAEDAALALSIMAAGSFVGAMTAGAIADRFGIKRTLLCTLLVAASLCVVLPRALALGREAFLVTAFLFGVALDGYRPVSAAAVGHSVKASERARAFSLVTWIALAGSAVAPALVALLTKVDWMLLFVQQAVGLAVVAMLLAVGLAPSSTNSSDVSQPIHGRPSVLAIASHNWKLLTATLLLSMASIQMTSNFPVALAARGVSQSLYSAALSVNSLAMLGFMLPVGAMANRLDPKLSMTCAGVVLALSLVFPAVSTEPASVFSYAVLSAAAAALVLGVGPAYASGVVVPSAMGTMHSLYGTAFALGIASGPLMGAIVLEAWGVAAHGFASAIVSLLAAGLFFKVEKPVLIVPSDAR